MEREGKQFSQQVGWRRRTVDGPSRRPTEINKIISHAPNKERTTNNTQTVDVRRPSLFSWVAFLLLPGREVGYTEMEGKRKELGIETREYGVLYVSMSEER